MDHVCQEKKTISHYKCPQCPHSSNDLDQKVSIYNMKETSKEKEEMKINNKMKGLWIADSIGSSIDKECFMNMTNSEITFKKAYTIQYDENARFPESNFHKVIKENMGDNTYDWVGLQGGTCDISNINTNVNALENIEYLKERTYINAENMFKEVLNIEKTYPQLEYIFLMERPPRYDPVSNDQFGLKAQLSEYANSLYKQFWYDNDCSSKIIIGDHPLLKVNDYKVMELYGHKNARDFDGVHLRTENGKFTYTKSVLLTFQRCWPNKHIDSLSTSSIEPRSVQERKKQFSNTNKNNKNSWNTIKTRTKPSVNPWNVWNMTPLRNKFSPLLNIKSN